MTIDDYLILHVGPAKCGFFLLNLVWETANVRQQESEEEAASKPQDWPSKASSRTRS